MLRKNIENQHTINSRIIGNSYSTDINTSNDWKNSTDPHVFMLILEYLIKL